MSSSLPRKLDREFSILSIMLDIYCRGNHAEARSGDSSFCPDCQALLDYAEQKLAKCPHGEEKPSCKDCSIRCYNKSYSIKIREVMRYSGWRFAVRHPIKFLLKKLN